MTPEDEVHERKVRAVSLGFIVSGIVGFTAWGILDAMDLSKDLPSVARSNLVLVTFIMVAQALSFTSGLLARWHNRIVTRPVEVGHMIAIAAPYAYSILVIRYFLEYCQNDSNKVYLTSGHLVAEMLGSFSAALGALLLYNSFFFVYWAGQEVARRLIREQVLSRRRLAPAKPSGPHSSGLARLWYRALRWFAKAAVEASERKHVDRFKSQPVSK